MGLMQYITAAKNHFVTITTHKLAVMKGCFQVGLYKQGLLHDLSKYTLTEFMTGVLYYQGTRSPNSAEREAKGYSSAWLHHKGRNRHHYEYWIDYLPHAGEGSSIVCGCKMPTKYVVEMFVDRVSACKIYNKEKFTVRDPWDYYHKGRTCDLLHEDTRKLLELLLKMYAKYGEAYTYAYIRKKILHNDKNILVRLFHGNCCKCDGDEKKCACKCSCNAKAKTEKEI